jgi:hypothetical protein
MDAPALLDCLLELATDTGLPVSRVGRQTAFEGLPLAASGMCRVRGELRVMLFDADPVAERIRVLARALREGRSAELEGRFLPPAVRECLERAGGTGAPRA